MFKDKGVLKEALASDAASLEVEPGPQEAAERRRVTAPRLRFEFDEQGVLTLGPRAGSGRDSRADGGRADSRC